jgi:hypothetical protein
MGSKANLSEPNTSDWQLRSNDQHDVCAHDRRSKSTAGLQINWQALLEINHSLWAIGPSGHHLHWTSSSGSGKMLMPQNTGAETYDS